MVEEEAEEEEDGDEGDEEAMEGGGRKAVLEPIVGNDELVSSYEIDDYQ
jgi:hypothetical protein